MDEITSSDELKKAIELLEFEQTLTGEQLKEQLFLINEKMKPVNLIKSTMSDVVDSPYIINNLLGTALGLLSGFVSRKLIIGASGSVLRKLIGTFTQVAVTTVASRNSDAISSFSRGLFYRILRKKKSYSKEL